MAMLHDERATRGDIERRLQSSTKAGFENLLVLEATYESQFLVTLDTDFIPFNSREELFGGLALRSTRFYGAKYSNPEIFGPILDSDEQILKNVETYLALHTEEQKIQAQINARSGFRRLTDVFGITAPPQAPTSRLEYAGLGSFKDKRTGKIIETADRIMAVAVARGSIVPPASVPAP